MSDRVSTVGVSHTGKRVGVLRVLLQLAAVALAYWFAAGLSLRLALVHGQVTPIWPPTGIALVAILVFGRRVWPALFVGPPPGNLPIGPTALVPAFPAAAHTPAPPPPPPPLNRAP